MGANVGWAPILVTRSTAEQALRAIPRRQMLPMLTIREAGVRAEAVMRAEESDLVKDIGFTCDF